MVCIKWLDTSVEDSILTTPITWQWCEAFLAPNKRAHSCTETPPGQAHAHLK